MECPRDPWSREGETRTWILRKLLHRSGGCSITQRYTPAERLELDHFLDLLPLVWIWFHFEARVLRRKLINLFLREFGGSFQGVQSSASTVVAGRIRRHPIERALGSAEESCKCVA